MAQASCVQNVDTIIIGGGLVGMTLALSLAAHGLEVAVVDAADLSVTLAPQFDGRASAIASASARLYEAIGLWPALEKVAEPIREIRVTDGQSPLFLHFDSAQLGDRPLGFMLENRQLRYGLLEAGHAAQGVHIYAPDRMVELTRDVARVQIVLGSGQTLRAPLLVAADGRRSVLREQMGIRIAQWSYAQSGIVTTVQHAQPHGQVAHERFLPDGPFAILPLPDNRSSIVWTVPERHAAAILGLSDRAFLAEIEKRFGDFLGDLTLAAPRWSYPLAFHHAERYIDDRFAMVGDAAHGIHPIAGQGLNMGLRDVAAFTQVIVESARLGLDIGAGDVLARYQRWRRPDNAMVCAVTDGLNRLFSNELKTVTLARRLGLAAVNKVAPLRGFFMREAMGATGKMPKLLLGQRA